MAPDADIKGYCTGGVDGAGVGADAGVGGLCEAVEPFFAAIGKDDAVAAVLGVAVDAEVEVPLLGGGDVGDAVAVMLAGEADVEVAGVAGNFKRGAGGFAFELDGPAEGVVDLGADFVVVASAVLEADFAELLADGFEPDGPITGAGGVLADGVAVGNAIDHAPDVAADGEAGAAGAIPPGLAPLDSGLLGKGFVGAGDVDKAIGRNALEVKVAEAGEEVLVVVAGGG